MTNPKKGWTRQKNRRTTQKNKINEQSREGNGHGRLSALPTSLLCDILSRLPARILSQLRCVSKGWNNLILDPHFAKMNLGRTSKDNLNIVIRDDQSHVVDLNLLNKAVLVNDPPTCPEGWTSIMGSCDGLLCVSNEDKDITLWNPLTGSCRRLPSANFMLPKYPTIMHSFIHGFGYDSVNDDYKVISILQLYHASCDYSSDDSSDSKGDNSCEASEVQVYSLKSNSWRRIGCFPYVLCNQCPGMLASGALHFLGHQGHCCDHSSFKIMAFDLGIEKCRELSPPDYDDDDFKMNLGVVQGSLCAVCRYPRRGIQIWVLKNYQSCTWTKLLSISPPRPLFYFRDVRPLIVSKNGCEVLLVLDGEELIWYNLRQKTVRFVKVRDLPPLVALEVFSGSLLDPKTISGCSKTIQRASNTVHSPNDMKKSNDIMQSKHIGQPSNHLVVLPEKLLCNILLRLPVDTLLLNQRVCKRWYNLISDPEFVKMHLEVSSNCCSRVSLILKANTVYSIDIQLLDKAVEVKHPLLAGEGWTDLVGTSNGLICLSKNRDFVLQNPWTGKHERVPPANFHVHDVIPTHFSINGFGYDLGSDDYKLVCMLQQHSRLKGGIVDLEVQVYSLKAKAWGRIQHFPYFVCSPCTGVLANGALHWVAHESPYLYSSSALLISFDLRTEQFRVLAQPDYEDTDFQMSLGLLRRSLCLLCHYPKQNVDLWVMTDYQTESWTKLISILQCNIVGGFQYLKPLLYSEDGSEVLFEQDNETLLWFNLTKKTVNYVKIHGLPKSFQTVVCSKSLVQLGHAPRKCHVRQEAAPKGLEKPGDKKRNELHGFLSKGFKLKL